MLLVKVLEKKWVIRLFGLGIFAAPFANIFLTMAFQQVHNLWTREQFLKVLQAQSLPNNLLNICSLAIGIMMFSGSKKAWKMTLGLLGAHILLQVPRLGPELRVSYWYGVFFLVNLVTFLFVADQLAFKQQRPVRVKEPKPEPQPENLSSASTEIPPPIPLAPRPAVRFPRTPIRSRKRVVVSLNGQEPWAQLTSIDGDGVEFRAFSDMPQELRHREVEIGLTRDLYLKLRFLSQTGDMYYFKYSQIDAEQVARINFWLKSLIPAA